MTKQNSRQKNILAVDCCDEILTALDRALDFNMATFNSRKNPTSHFPVNDTDLIVVGVSNAPVRRLFISRLRRFFPEVPMLVLRRETLDYENFKEQIRGEFILSDQFRESDLEIVKSAQRVLPLKFARKTKSRNNYDLVRDVTRVIAEHFADPELNLSQVAVEIPTSPSRLSRILNKQVGISFRQLLRHIRIEEAKRMLISHRYSVKEVAARVGFSDSHYFSRSFKELTGSNPTEYEHNQNDVIFN